MNKPLLKNIPAHAQIASVAEMVASTSLKFGHFSITQPVAMSLMAFLVSGTHLQMKSRQSVS